MTDNWTLWNDKGQLSDEAYTEKQVRDILSADESGTVYAQNASGDLIETYDGPVHVGSQGMWYVYHERPVPGGTEQIEVATRINREETEKMLSKHPHLTAKCPATGESLP